MIAEFRMMGKGLVEVIEPEYLVFANYNEFLRGFVSAANNVEKNLGSEKGVSYKKRSERPRRRSEGGPCAVKVPSVHSVVLA